MAETIYKLASRTLWNEAAAEGVFTGAPIDLEDGYIHFSTSEQVVETAHKHFRDQSDILLISISVERLEDLTEPLVWEPSRGGALFPHLYCPMPLEAVTDIEELPLGEDGLHQFPISFDSPSR